VRYYHNRPIYIWLIYRYIYIYVYWLVLHYVKLYRMTWYDMTISTYYLICFHLRKNNTKVCPSRVDPERRSMIQPLKASGDRIPGVCLKNRAGGSPIAGRFIVENSKQKMMIYGYRHFRKPTSLGRSKQWSTLTVMVSPTPLQEMGQNIHYPVVIQGG